MPNIEYPVRTAFRSDHAMPIDMDTAPFVTTD